MSKKNEPNKALQAVKYDAETIAAIALKVKAEGFVPKADLVAAFGAEKVTQAIAILYRDFRMFVETRERWKDGQEALGYKWSDRRFSGSQIKKIPPELGFVCDLAPAMRTRYADWKPIKVFCRWLVPVLGSVPVKNENDDPTNEFEYDREGSVLILRYHLRAMASRALPMIGKEGMSLASRIGWSFIRLTSPSVKLTQHGIVELGRQGGKGLRTSQKISDGTEFVIEALIPTTEISPAEFIQMLRLAGKYVGLSPGRSAGFGDFEVLGAE